MLLLLDGVGISTLVCNINICCKTHRAYHTSSVGSFFSFSPLIATVSFPSISFHPPSTASATYQLLTLTSASLTYYRRQFLYEAKHISFVDELTKLLKTSCPGVTQKYSPTRRSACKRMFLINSTTAINKYLPKVFEYCLYPRPSLYHFSVEHWTTVTIHEFSEANDTIEPLTSFALPFILQLESKPMNSLKTFYEVSSFACFHLPHSCRTELHLSIANMSLHVLS